MAPLLAQAARARRAGRRWSASSGRPWRVGPARRTNSPCSARGSTWPGSTSSRRTAGAVRRGRQHDVEGPSSRGSGIAATDRRHGHPPPGPLDHPDHGNPLAAECRCWSTRCSTTRHPHHRVLRRGRSRQDDDRGGAGRTGRRAGPEGRRAHHRPGAPARAVHGHRLRSTTPRAGSRASTDAPTANCTP